MFELTLYYMTLSAPLALFPLSWAWGSALERIGGAS